MTCIFLNDSSFGLSLMRVSFHSKFLTNLYLPFWTIRVKPKRVNLISEFAMDRNFILRTASDSLALVVDPSVAKYCWIPKSYRPVPQVLRSVSSSHPSLFDMLSWP